MCATQTSRLFITAESRTTDDSPAPLRMNLWMNKRVCGKRLIGFDKWHRINSHTRAAPLLQRNGDCNVDSHDLSTAGEMIPEVGGGGGLGLGALEEKGPQMSQRAQSNLYNYCSC